MSAAWKAMQHQRTEKPIRDSVRRRRHPMPDDSRTPANEIIIFNCFHPIFEFVFSTLNLQTV
jgi:hypothetical protein